MVWICTSQASDVEHLFTCSWAMHISSLVKCLFRSVAQFLIELFVLLLSCKNYLYILDAGILFI